MSETATFERVADIISEICGIDRATITPESHAIKDLGIDSLDFLDVAFAIDKAFGIKMPLEQWTQEVNDGGVSGDTYFVLQGLCDNIDKLVAAKGLKAPAMRLEYFQMIDRIAELDLGARTIACDSTLPEQSPIFEGHFPGYPIMPGVLMIETMAQAGGWLVMAGLGFRQMAFLAKVGEAKMRSFLAPGTPIRVEADQEHDGSGYAIVNGRIRAGGKLVCEATITYRVMNFPSPALREGLFGMARRVGVPEQLLEGHGA